jgi:colanic acid/amylovoran biosynthesis protein
MSQRVALTAATLTGNHGAEAMVSTIAGRLREGRDDLSFLLLSYYPADDRAVLTAPDFDISSSTPKSLVLSHLPGALLAALLPRKMRATFPLVPKPIRKLSQCDMLVCMAGVAFIDGREKFLPFNILTILPALLLGIPVVKAAQASGPYRNPLNRLMARLFLPRCRAIHARGARTLDHLEGLGLKNVIPAPDAAFGLGDGDRLVAPTPADLDARLAAIAGLRDGGRRVVGVCPSSVVYAKSGDGYLDALADLVSRLEADGHAIVFVPNATRAHADTLRNNDLPVIAKLRERLPPAPAWGRVDIDTDIDAVSIKAVIGACDVMVVSRFHAMVGALALATPALVFGWSHKYAEVMADFGMQEWVFDYAAISMDDIHPRFSALIADCEAASAAIAERLPEVKARSARQIETMRAVLAERAGAA